MNGDERDLWAVFLAIVLLVAFVIGIAGALVMAVFPAVKGLL